MVEVETINIHDKNYLIISKINNNQTTYLYLVNEDDNKDFIVQKYDTKEENIISLDNKEEFDKAMLLYTNEQIKNA